MVGEVKATMHELAVAFDITTRRTKSDIVLKMVDKANADLLAKDLKTRFGDLKRVRRSAPSISLLLLRPMTAS